MGYYSRLYVHGRNQSYREELLRRVFAGSGFVLGSSLFLEDSIQISDARHDILDSITGIVFHCSILDMFATKD